MDRPRRTTRSSLASSTGAGGSPSTPVNSNNNPYKKPTYYSSGRGNGGDGVPSSSSGTPNGTPTTSRRGRRGRGRPPGRPSMSRGGGQGHHTKPECIAVRVDGRRSTGGSTASSVGGRRGGGSRRSTYNSRELEYHYGSDFESDQNESDLEDLESGQEESDADSISLQDENERNAESDSDYSVGSTRVPGSRLPSPPVPIWLDQEKVPEIPKLELPNSSDDLLLSREHVVKAVEIYEPLRRFQQLVRLSPFRFEDFCAALASDDQSALLAEIHIQLLKSVIREEEANGTLFGPNEVKDSVQAIVYFCDHITWPETLRSYLESDSAWADVYDALVSVEYPFCEPDVRIKVLGLLVDQFLTTSAVREQLLGDGTIMHEDHCRACNRLGELICCESCPAVYHIECITQPIKDFDYDNPPDDWNCPLCSKHKIAGVNDCTSEVEKMGLLIRHERLGYDRHGRKYWFLVRRVLVESEDGSEVWYYSTKNKIGDLLSNLDADNYEDELAANIKASEEEIYRQMAITEEVTNQQNTQRRKIYLDVESGKDNEGMDGPERMTRLKSTGLYKLGQEGLHRTYTNHFTTDPLALGKGKANEERDRKRYMSHKFSLTTASECKYGIKDLVGCPRSVQVNALKNALTHMEAVLPTTLMHVNWPVLRKTWLATVQCGQEPIDFSKALIMISACIRNAVYNPVWTENAGHVRYSRMSLLEREEKKKAEKRDKKDKDDEEDRLKGVLPFVKYTLPLRHQVYKQKGEEYRLHGRWGWIWLSNMRRCKSQDCRQKGLLAGPHKHVIQVKNETGKVKTMLIDPGVYSKLMAKRSMAVSSSGAGSASKSNNSAAPSGVPSTSSDSKNCAAAPGSESSPSEKECNDALDSTSPGDAAVQSSEEMSSKKNEENKCVNIAETEKGQESSDTPQESDEIQKNVNNQSAIKKADGEELVNEKKIDATVGPGKEESLNEKKIDATNIPGEKFQPMEVDEDVQVQASDSQLNEIKPEIKIELDAEDTSTEKNGDNQLAESEMATDEENTAKADLQKFSEEGNKEPDGKKMDVDMEEIGGVKKQVEDRSALPETEDEHLVNGGVEELPAVETTRKIQEEANPSSEKLDEQSSAPHEELPTMGMAPSQQAVESNESEPKTTTQTSAGPEIPVPSNSQTAVTTEKTGSEDAQGRKFRTELVNVSGGLTSTHRILYPKVAKRCDYLDSLLQRKLALKSLEEKTLNSEYGEEVVSKAKEGIEEFEREEKKRAQEEEEYPEVEGIDNALILGGAYAYCCYSNECRKAAQDFLKEKGKNRERLYEKICYSPMCRLKFCLQETVRLKHEKEREQRREKVYSVFKEIEAKRVYTNETTSQKVYMKKLPDCVLAILNGPNTTQSKSDKKKKISDVKYPQVSSFNYMGSKKPSILVLPQYELSKLARTSGRTFTPSGFFPTQKSGGWGWSLPCGRPVFRTAWQYKTTHAKTLGAAAMQLRILYASIRWDDIVTKIPNNDGRHQVHTDTEIITTEILSHRIVGRFMERVQYLRKMMVVPIDAPKTIRAKMRENSEITPSRIGLRKRKRAESPDKTEPVVSEDWVDEERLELWEIRYYGDRIDRRIDRRSESGTPSSSTRTKSGVAIKQPEKFDPSHNPTHGGERKSYPAHPQQQQNAQKEAQVALTSPASNNMVASSPSTSMSDNLDKTIENVVRNHVGIQEPELPSYKNEGRPLSAVKGAELMRETLELQRSAHVSKRDKHNNGNGAKPSATPQPTASQQFQQQLQQNNGKGGASANQLQPQKNASQGTTSTPTSSKVGGVILGKKFFPNRQAAAINNSSGLDTGLLTKRPMQNTITINKGAGGSISIVKNPTSQPAPPQTQQQHGVVVPTTTAVAVMTPGAENTPMVGTPGQQQQRVTLFRLPDGRLQVKGLLPGQTCYQTADGRIHVTGAGVTQTAIAGTQGQMPPITPTAGSIEQPQLNSTSGAAESGSPAAISSSGSIITSHTSTSVSSMPNPQSQQLPVTNAVPNSPGMTISNQQVATSQQQPVININSQVVKSNISGTTSVPVTSQTISKPMQPHHVIIQQANGQHIILQGPAAQALLLQHQQQQQQRLLSGGTSSPKTNVTMKSPVVVSSTNTTSTSQITLPGRILIQDGKAVLISGQPTAATTANSTTGGVQQRSIMLNQPIIQTSVATSPAVTRPQIIQTSMQGQVLQNQGLQVIKHGNGYSIISSPQGVPASQSGQQFVMEKQQTEALPNPTSTAGIMTPLTSNSSSNSGHLTSSGTTVSSAGVPTVITPSSVATTTSDSVSASADTTLIKHILPDGRAILLSSSQLGELSAGGRKIVVNKPLFQNSGPNVVRPQTSQQQVIQTLGSGQPTIQILQGSGGQQFLIQQPSTGIHSPHQQGHQQMQIMVSGAQYPGQPVLLKKFVKPVSGSQQQGVVPHVVNKAGSGVQIPPTAQNQLTQLIGPNKTLVRLDNNQLAAIPTPVSQATSVETSTSTESDATSTQQRSPAKSSSPKVSVSGSTGSLPNSTQQSNQTTITRTPGLPISIVSPSKAKQGGSPKSGIVSLSSSTVSSTPMATQMMSPAKSSASKAGAKSTPPSGGTSLNTPNSPVKKAVPPAAPVFATKSAPPQITSPTQQKSQISTSPSSPVAKKPAVISTAASASAGLITATKSLPETIQQENAHAMEKLPETSSSTPQTTTVPSATHTAAANISPGKPKSTPNKIVAQIFQTAEGPKVVIQGVNPGELTPAQMSQLQQQIQKTLAAQQQQQASKGSTPSVGSPLTAAVSAAVATLNPPSTSASQQSVGSKLSNAVSTPSNSTNSKQQSSSRTTPLLSPTSLTANAQRSSPIEVLRSTTPTSSIRSPPPPMLPPGKIISPPSYIPNLLSSKAARMETSTSNTFTTGVSNSVPETSVPDLSSPPPPLVVARKSAPRKSPIKTNNLDSPPHIMLPPPPPPALQNSGRGTSNAADELMQPLNAEQQQILDEKKETLKKEIVSKKKAAAAQMRLEAQREIQTALEKARTNAVAANTASIVENSSAKMANSATPAGHQNSVPTPKPGGRHYGGRGKKRGMKTSVNNVRSSLDDANSTTTTYNKKDTPTGGGGKKKRKLFCICETPYDKKRFYVGCDRCDNWFHGDCIGITEEMSKDLQEYICDNCKDDKLYCVCQKPYNDSQFYIQCDKCEDWLHGRCVGVLPGEAESIGDYICPKCEPNSDINAPNNKLLDTSDYVALNRLVKEILANRSSLPFRKPVTKAQAPNYYSIIKEPMDLQTVTKRAEERKYEKLRDFIGDLVKIFENCRYYNDSNTDIYRHADNLEKYCVQKICSLRQNFNTRARQGFS